MSAGPTDPPGTANLVEETRKQINRLFEEVARLAEMDLPPVDFYAEFLKRVLQALAAPAGAVWGRTAQGNLQLQYQISMPEVGLNASEEARASHDELLRKAVMQPQPRFLAPRSSEGPTTPGGVGAGNPTEFLNLLVPIVVDNQVAGLLEVWQAPDRHPNAIPGFLQFMARMAELATRYTRNYMMRTMVGQQQLWVQLEAFARQIHSSLNPVECAYLIANEGRRLIECDRVSLGLRYSRRVTVEAISGADVVEKRSNVVQLQRKLFDKVLKWGEKLVFSGTQDDTLPPDVHTALDAYLAESNSKLLVVLPLKDEREIEKENEGGSKKPPRSAMMMECFEPNAAPDQLFARLEVVGRHAAPALYNAIEHRRIPFRFVWMPIAAVQEGLGGKAKAIAAAIAAGVLAIVLILIFVWYPLKMDSSGKLQPQTRQVVYAPTNGKVAGFYVIPNQEVGPRANLIRLYDPDLAQKMTQLEADLRTALDQQRDYQRLITQAKTAAEAAQRAADMAQAKATAGGKAGELAKLISMTNADRTKPGEFWVRSPAFPPQGQHANQRWTILSSDFRETLNDRGVKPSDPLLRLGDQQGEWEVELKIPQKHIGQVLKAFKYLDTDELDVDILVRSEPTSVYKGKLSRKSIAGEATPNKDDNNEAEPVVVAWVRLSGDGIRKEYSLPEQAPELLVADTEVHAKIRCGDHRMGYSLFYGVWEFIYEKVVFFF